MVSNSMRAKNSDPRQVSWKGENSSMPAIEVTMPQGTLSEERLEPLLQDLTRSLIKWEGVADPDDPRARTTVLASIYEVPDGRYARGSESGASMRVLVQISIPHGVLT